MDFPTTLGPQTTGDGVKLARDIGASLVEPWFQHFKDLFDFFCCSDLMPLEFAPNFDSLRSWFYFLMCCLSPVFL